MDGNSRLIIAFFILFIGSGLSQRHGSYGYQPSSIGSISQGFGGGLSFAGQIGGNREGGDRRVSDSGSWNSFGSSNVEDNNRKVSSSGNGNNQWSGGSGWNSGSQTGGYGGGKPATNAGGLGFGSSQSGNQGSSGWNIGSQNKERVPGDQNKDENQRKTNSGSRRPGSSSESSTSDFLSFQSDDSKKDSDYGGSSLGFDSKRPQSSSTSGGNSNWGSGSGSKRPQGSSTGGNSNWNSGNQNGGSSGVGFSSSKQEENQGKPNSGWNSGAGDSSRRPQGSSSSHGNSNFGSSSGSKNPQGSSGGLSWGSDSDSKRPQGGTSSGSSNWGSNSNSNSKRPQGGSSSSNGNSGASDSKRPQGGSSSGSSNWGSNSNSNSKRPQGGSSSDSSDWGFNPDSDAKIPEDAGGLNFGSNSNSDSKRPQSNSNSNWGSSSSSGSKKPQGNTNGGTLNFGSSSNSDSKRPEGSNSGGNSNWSSGFTSNRPQSSSGNSGSGYSSSKKPEDNRQKPSSNSGQRPSSNTDERPNKQSGRPSNSQPEKAGGNGKGSDIHKPNDNGNTNANKTKTVEADWSNLETQNQQSSLVFDLSELWHPNDKKDPAWRSIWTRNRFRRDDALDKTGKSSLVCHCTDYTACSPENRMNVLKFLENDHQDLRVQMVECATKKKICCATTKREESGGKHPTCGRRMSKLAEHDISNDGLANYGDYPWMLKLVAVGDNGEETLCGASLIHNSIALTTASCALLLTGKIVRARSGEWNVVGGNDKNMMEETTVEKVYLHPEFDVITYSKDLALLFLHTPLHYNRGVNTICLPTHHDAWNPNKCVVVGWSKKNGSGLKSAVLRQVDLEIVAQGKCRHRDGLKNGLSDLEDPGYLCAHTRKDDPYLGDVGASLLCPLHNTDGLIQVGFISKTIPGKRDGKATTFTDILGSLDWVYRMEGLYAFVKGEDYAD